MKNLLLATLCFCSVFNAQAEEKVTLDSLLQERIELNIKYSIDYVKEAETEGLADVAKIEKELGNEWNQYLIHVKTSNDSKLKIHTLRLEYLDELIGVSYDANYLENELEKANAKIEAAKWKEKLAILKKLVAETKLKKTQN